MTKVTNRKGIVLEVFGGPSAVAEICSVSPAAVSQWDFIPMEHIPALWKVAKKKQLRIELRDLFPDAIRRLIPSLRSTRQTL